MLKILKIMHYILLYIIVILCVVIFIIFKNTHSLIWLSGIIVVLHALGSTSIIIHSIKKGKDLEGSKDQLITNFLSSYRKLLLNKIFLFLSIFCMTVFTCILVYQIFYFRLVEFETKDSVVLFLCGNNDVLVKIGHIPSDGNAKFRLRIGKQRLLYQEHGTDKYAIPGEIFMFIPPIWSNIKLQQPVILNRINDFEYLR